MTDRKINVLMCGSDVGRTKGGIVSVISNYLNYAVWKNVELTYIPTHMDGTKKQKLSIFYRALPKIRTVLKNGDADVVHLHMSERGSVYRKAKIVKLCRQQGVPVIIHHHGAEFLETVYAMKPSKRKKVQSMLEAADLNLVLSRDFKKELKQIAPNAAIEVLPNAVQTFSFAAGGDRSYITTLGRLGSRKGTYDLIKAMKIADTELAPNVKLCLCGDGELDEVKKKISESGLQDRIAHIGWVQGEQKLEILCRTMMHVLPSYKEGLPMSILETMGMGIPNIASRVNAIPEVIEDHENGILIDAGEPEQLAGAILELAKSEELREKLGTAAKQHIDENYTLEIHLEKLEKIYATLKGTGTAAVSLEPDAEQEAAKETEEETTEKVTVRKGGLLRNLLLSVAMVAAVVAVILGVNIRQNQTFGETFYHVKSAKVREGFRIAMLSDLHNHEYGESNTELTERIAKLQPDIIAIAGDMVIKDDPDTEIVTTLCAQLVEIAPVFYSMGNHEGIMIYDKQIPLDQELKELGVNVLYNDAKEIEINGNRLLIGGVGTPPEMYEEYSAAFVEEYEKSDEFKLMLAHYPSLFYECMADAEIDLSLSGHFHGGQIRIPGLGGLLAIPDGFFPEYCEGQFEREDGKGTLIVGRGLGEATKLPRINNQPELVIIDVERY